MYRRGMAHTRTTLEGAQVTCVCPAPADHEDVGVVHDKPGSLTDTIAERPDIITGVAAEDDSTDE